MTSCKIHPPDVADLERLQEIERLAGVPFRDIGMDAIADDPPPPIGELHGCLDRRELWVVRADDSEPAGYLHTSVVDGTQHIEQVSIDPAFGHRRLGARLIDFAGSLALGQGRSTITLTTFRDVPWNAPYYRRIGFVEVAEADWGEGLRQVRDWERERGLDAWPRVVMARDALWDGPVRDRQSGG